MSAYLEYTEPNVCISENLTTDDAGLLRMERWAVPRLVADVRARSGGDGKVYITDTPPGKLLIDQQVGWKNDSPLEQMVQIRICRSWKSWVVSNPNAIQIRDRWSRIITDKPGKLPADPVTTNIMNSRTGTSIDLGSNSVAEPEPGVHYVWIGASTEDEIVGPVGPGESIKVWYKQYLWTPPPWSDNANKNNPIHQASTNWTRIMLTAFPQQGRLVTG
ncbi:hypothetical protein SEA_YAHALOM_36 [Mycobacterium phage Yahalom]|uniref:DUF7172 domain-containing protein n=2 Tax=Pipefishvirus TaxID=1982899 RepID=A0A514TXZ8_9CAUD|nr:gp36 [Mycobacterium phage Phlyer]YP_010103825.1 hypothetical protein KNU70_gp036 [Mycobacterium phage Obutu]YP_655315.1 gp38 [Mycobacterium phage Pipefish]AEJ94708.1 hypothetical protein DAISY_36 [Mycobacterium phage Daisy]AVR55956.1 hypothetical protein SEA_YAHALOM_36 [Mycobacterium phage Yahalom]QAY13651.1 hypothetical protein SEA_ROMAT_36 [Mycobacterium phage RomaT]QDK01668.1 hypothetical protein RITA1961_36 [Mycobacterium phage Rita1961]QOI67337.1 hypothetical protein SEA_GERVAS_36 [M